MWKSWVGARTSGFDFGLGLDPDPTYQWDTKRKLFSLADVCALYMTDQYLYRISIYRAHSS